MDTLKTEAHEVIRKVADIHQITVADLLSRSRRRLHVEARQEAMRLVRALGFSFAEVGEFFERDHTTVMHACGKIEKAHETGLLAVHEPSKWTDTKGRTWKTPTIKGRIKFRTPGALALREFVLSRDGRVCLACGSSESDAQLVADHIISRRNGGSHHPRNLQTLCESCNARKSNLVDRKVSTC